MSHEVLLKLEDAFSISATDKEACFYAGISTSTLYVYQDKNPEFSERKENLKNKSNLKARQTIVQSLDDVRVAQWWLEKKRPDEFANKQKLEHSGKIEGDKISYVGPYSPETNMQLKFLANEYEAKLKQAIIDGIRSRTLQPGQNQMAKS